MGVKSIAKAIAAALLAEGSVIATAPDWRGFAVGTLGAIATGLITWAVPNRPVD